MNYPGSLHNHTHFSNIRLRDAIIEEKELIDYAIELNHEVIAITEHDCVSNSIKVQKYYNKIKEKNPNFKVILGNEIYLCRDGLTNENFIKNEDKYFHFILLAKDAMGHQQIREISTRAWTRSYEAQRLRRVPTYYSDLIEIIGSNRGHVIGSSACLGGWLPTMLLRYKETQDNTYLEKITNWLNSMVKLFGDGNFYLELQPSAYDEQRYVNRKLIELSNQFNIPYIITTDSHYLKKEDAPLHEAFLNSQNGDREVASFYTTTYMMSTKELESYLTDLTREEIDIAYRNIQDIKNKCEDYNLLKPLKIPELLWKEYPHIDLLIKKYETHIPYLRTFSNSTYKGDRILADAIVQKLEKDSEELCNKETYDAIDECLKMTWISSEVNKTHWSAYYLNLQKIIDTCWEAGSIVGPGRGSGVGFILLYILDITQINPLRESVRTYPWRFLNPSRVSVLDVDFDIEGGRRQQVLNKFREVYGEDRVANVITFGSEKSKSALLTAARGLGIDVDEAQYFAGLIPSDRGITRTLSQCYYGDEENDFKPIPLFVAAMNENPELWKVAQKIEGLVCRCGIHAGGVIFVDEPFTNSTALMRAPDNTIVTAFDLHDCEDVSLIKYDTLSVEAEDKIHTCIDLLCDAGHIERKSNSKETYESTIGIYNLERDEPKMWEMVWNREILSLFQMEKQSGIQGIALTKPKSVEDLAHLNSIIRLMAEDKKSEQPLNKFARFKNDISLWYKEMDEHGLTKEEQEILKPYVEASYGIAESQECFMQLVQIPECGGFDLNFADRLRKSIAKKNPAEYEKITQEYFTETEKKGLSKNLCNYVWNVLVATSRGYGFNLSHTLAYSLVALQEMNLAYKYPIIYWNCANLIVDSGGADPDSSTDYKKIAKAIGEMKNAGVEISLVNINESQATFVPDEKENKIWYGLKGVSNVGNELINEIIAGRPYSSMLDFYNRVKPGKQAMIALIKGGAFDIFQSRSKNMVEFIWMTCDKKSRLTLQNMPSLIKYNLLPKDKEYEIPYRVYEFNRYLKANCKLTPPTAYQLDSRAIDFLNELGLSNLYDNSTFIMEEKAWSKTYSKYMDTYRNWLSSNKEEILNKLNNAIFLEDWNKYSKKNSLSRWEMDALCFYYHEHELAHVNKNKYGLVNFFDLPEEPVIERIFCKGDKQIPLYKIYKICGTCIAKDKDKSTVHLLTDAGVVPVKFPKEYFSIFDKQISQKQTDGSKKVIERSWFNKGNMIMVQGIRRGNEFVIKKYNSTPGHRLCMIDDIDDNGNLTIRSERKTGIEEEDNE